MSAASAASPIFSGILREEILAVVSRHVKLDPDKVLVKMDRGKSMSTLEVDIELPNGFDQLVRTRLPEHQLV